MYEKYDFRYSQVVLVVVRLMGGGWLTEADREALSEKRKSHSLFLGRCSPL